jgi:hypothetical protein
MGFRDGDGPSRAIRSASRRSPLISSKRVVSFGVRSLQITDEAFEVGFQFCSKILAASPISGPGSVVVAVWPRIKDVAFKPEILLKRECLLGRQHFGLIRFSSVTRIKSASSATPLVIPAGTMVRE